MINPIRIAAMENAIQVGDANKVRLLLKAGVPAGHTTDRSSFAQQAARHGNVEILDILIDAGATLDGTLLIPALYSSSSVRDTVVRKVLDAAKPSTDELNHALMRAVEDSSLEVVQMILEAGADYSFTDKSRSTPLLQAVYFDNEAAATLLLKQGADPWQRVPHEDFYKLTIHEVAQAKGMTAFLQALASCAPSTQRESESGRTPLTVAECWEVIDNWLAQCAPTLTLGPPVDAAEVDRVENIKICSDFLSSLRIHDGSSDIAIIPMPNDVSHVLLGLCECVEEREIMLGVFDSEKELQDPTPDWWREDWLPISSNGAGDYLVIDGIDGSVHYFSHETRTRTIRASTFLELLQDIAGGVVTEKYLFTASQGVV